MGDEAREAIEDRPGNIERIARPPNHHRHRPGLCAVVAAADRSVEDMYSARSRSLVEPDHRLGQPGGLTRHKQTQRPRIQNPRYEHNLLHTHLVDDENAESGSAWWWERW